jgi:uncharacterized protein (TIRG00374 family)
MKKWIFTILKVGAGLALLLVSVWGIDWNKLASTITSLNSGWLLVGILSVLAGLGLKSWRWYVLLRSYGIEASFSQAAGAFFLGQAANIILPVRGGELLRFGWLRSQQERGSAEIATTIVIEKYLDLLMLLALTILLTVYLPIVDIKANSTVLIIAGVTLTLALISLIWMAPKVWRTWQGKIKAKVPAEYHKVIDSLERWFSASSEFRRPAKAIPPVGITLVIWGVMLSTNLILFSAFSLPISLAAGVLVLAAIYIGVVPALMPGNVGPFYFFASLALAPFGIDPQVRIAYAIVLHALVTVPPLLLAGISVLLGRGRLAQPGLQKNA